MKVAFCEASFVQEISIEQRTPIDREEGLFPLLFRGELNRFVEAGEVVELSAGSVERIHVDNTQSISSEEGTWIFIAVVSSAESGFVGRFTVGENGVPSDSWLPTQSEETATPCEFWEDFTN